MEQRTRRLVLLSLLGGMGVVLRMFDFPILPAAPFLKVDLSEIPVFIGMLTNGPFGLICVAFVRDLLNFLIKGGEAGIPIGAIMSFIASFSLFIPTHFVLKRHATALEWRDYLKIAIYSAFLLVVTMSLFNYFIALPIYIRVLNFPIESKMAFIKGAVIPFNLIKSLLMTVMQWGVIQIAIRSFKPYLDAGYIRIWSSTTNH